MEEKISTVHLQMRDGKPCGFPVVEGYPTEVLSIGIGVCSMVLTETAEHRRAFRKAARKLLRDTRPDWVRYLLEGWPSATIGAIVLTLCVFGFCYLVHGVLGL